MAYPVSPGSVQYSGRFIPEIWSKKVVAKFYAATVLAAISNSDYEGEVANVGDKVIIRQIPNITVRPYAKNQTLIYEQPESENVELLLDKGYYWGVTMDDVDKVQMDIDWINKFSMDASSQLKISIDTLVLSTLYADASATNSGLTAGAKSGSLNLGVSGTPLAIDKTNVIDVLVTAGVALDENNIPEEGRWIVLPPHIIGALKMSDIKDASLTGDGVSVLRNGRVGMIDRFTVYSSNLLASVTDTEHTVYHMIFGHKTGLTFASQIPVGKVDRIKSETTFGEKIRGLCVFGYKTVLPTAIGHLYGYKA